MFIYLKAPCSAFAVLTHLAVPNFFDMKQCICYNVTTRCLATDNQLRTSYSHAFNNNKNTVLYCMNILVFEGKMSIGVKKRLFCYLYTKFLSEKT